MKHLYSIQNCSDKKIRKLIAGAYELWDTDVLESKIRRKAAVALIFLEDSTRTRLSFERACQFLGLKYVNMMVEHSSLSKGESLRESVEVMRDFGVSCFVIRSKQEGIYEELSQIEGISLVNAGEGIVAHPTQVLGDAAALCLHLKLAGPEDLNGFRMSIVGDLRHSRVARSWSSLAPRLGIKLSFISPKEWAPESWGKKFPHFTTLAEGLENSDAVMALRVQNERHASKSSGVEDYASQFQLKAESLAGRPLLHPGPVNWGVELSSELQTYPNSLLSLQRQSCYALRVYLLNELCR